MNRKTAPTPNMNSISANPATPKALAGIAASPTSVMKPAKLGRDRYCETASTTLDTTARPDAASRLPRLPIAGSDTGDTRAKPNVWSDKAKFDSLASKMQEEMAKLNAAANRVVG